MLELSVTRRIPFQQSMGSESEKGDVIIWGKTNFDRGPVVSVLCWG